MIKANFEQLPIYQDSECYTYHFERDIGILEFTVWRNKPGQSASASWLVWDDQGQDWISKPVLVREVIDLIPERLFTS